MAVAEWVAGLDADAVCEAVRVRHVALLETEAEQFYLAAHWADLHPGETVEDDRRTRRRRSGGRVLPGTERGVRLGADGTPLVAEFAPAELGALQGLGHLAVARLIGDALTVRHRHPLLWLALAEGRVRVWQARKAAQLCADAARDQTQARWVDEQTTPYLGLLPWGRFQTLLHARIIEADPAAAEERRRAAALARFVRTGQSTEHGIKTLVARAAAGDVIFFVAMVDRIAQVLCENGDTDPADVLRSKAIGILATPARALSLLHASTAAHTALENDPDLGRPGDVAEELDHTLHAGATDETGAEVEDPDKVGETVVHPSQNDAPDPAGEPGPQTGPCPACAGTGQATGDPTAFVKQPVHPKQLPNATLYIHISSGHAPRRTRPGRTRQRPSRCTGGAVRRRRPDHPAAGGRVPRPHQRPGGPGPRPGRAGTRRRLRGARPDGRGAAPAQPRLRVPLGDQPVPPQGQGPQPALPATPTRRATGTDPAGQPRRPHPVRAPAQDPRPVAAVPDRPGRVALAQPARLLVPHRPHRHRVPGSHRRG